MVKYDDTKSNKIDKFDKTNNINIWAIPGQMYFSDNMDSMDNTYGDNKEISTLNPTIETVTETKRLNRVSKKYNIPKRLTNLAKNLRIDQNDIVIIINDSKAMYERINKIDSITKWEMTKTMIIYLIDMFNDIFIAFKGMTLIFTSDHNMYYENIRHSREVDSIFIDHGFNFKETCLTECTKFIINNNIGPKEIIIFTSEIPLKHIGPLKECNDELNFIRLLQSKPKTCRMSIILLSAMRDVTKYYKGVIDDLYKVIDKSITNIGVFEEYNIEHSKLLKLDNHFITFNYTYHTHILVGLILPYFESVYDIHNIICEKRDTDTYNHKKTKSCNIL